MGQYHVPYAFDQATFALRHLMPYPLARGLKAWEQLDGNVGNALAWLLAVAPGTAPADLGQYDPAFSQGPIEARVIGSWAGKRLILAGDYAMKDDIAEWDGPALKELHGLRAFGGTSPEQESNDAWSSRSTTPRPAWRSYHEAWLERQRYAQRWQPIANDTATVAPMLERVKRIAFTGKGAWLDEKPARRTDNFNRKLKAQGQMRVLLNLDKMEFLDPKTFGAPRTTAGMVISSRFGDALLTSLFHPSSRGGGDLPEDAKLPEAFRGWAGRWHGDRLIATAEHALLDHVDWPTTTAAIDSGKDLSQLAKAYVDHLHEG